MNYLDILIMISFILWGISELVIMLFSKRNENREVNKKSTIYPVIRLSLSIGILIGILAKINKIYFLYSTSYWFPIFGILFVLIGMTVRWAAFLTLKRYFTSKVMIQMNHKLINTGIYSTIRHPAYSGAIISFFGLGICYANWLSFLIIFVPYTFAILSKIKYEEDVLEKHFSEEYLKYRNATKKIIPFIY